MDTRKIYTVVNSNAEGYNLLGIFDSKEGAEAAAALYNSREKENLRELFKNDSEKEIGQHMEFFDWWDSAKVVEETMNTMRH